MQKFSIILIILSILVPSMLGYVKKSRDVQEMYENNTTAYEDNYYDDVYKDLFDE